MKLWAILKKFTPRKNRVRLKRPFEEEEIKAAIDDCEGENSPSPDGFTLEAFKRWWKIIKDDLLSL